MANKSLSMSGQCRTVALSRIDVQDGFNPRTTRDPKRFEQLVASIRQDGVLQPVLVCADGADRFRLIAGEGRYLAAAEAGCNEIPVIVRETDERTGGLELAMVENLAREDLDPVQEAHGYQRLRETGLTKKGIAERLGIAQKRVTERLTILELSEQLHPAIADGTIPPGAIKALLVLVRIHPGLPVVVAGRVGAQPANQWDQPLTWSEVAEDPLGALVADYEDEPLDLPADVYDAGRDYPVARFTLSEKAHSQLVALCKLIGCEPDQFAVRFGREAVEQALALGAAAATSNGWHHLIVGQQVADQIAGDYIADCLRSQRATARREREHHGATAAHSNGEQAGGTESEEDVKARRRAEREAEHARRRAAHAFNLELGAEALKHLARLKVDADVLKVLTAIDVASDLASVAARGARYGFPGWPEETQRKNATIKVEYLDKEHCAVRAREFLAVASGPAEIAGRLFCLIAMARYANEQDAVANSNRSFYELRVGSGLPYSDEVLDTIDRICAQRLPDHLTKAVRDQRARAVKQDGRRRRQASRR